MMPQAQPHTPQPTPQALADYLAGAGFNLSGRPLEQLAEYISLLQQWNKVMNLVGPERWQDITGSLALDSFYLRDFLSGMALPASPICWDFGSGAGLPGIPLRILWQDGCYDLVEAREKRALFMRTALARMGLPRTQVTQGRVENFMAKARPADLLISRAFMPWDKLLGLMQGKLAPEGQVLVMALEPPPLLPSYLAAHWRLQAEYAYSIPAMPEAHGPQKRFFWLLCAI